MSTQTRAIIDSQIEDLETAEIFEREIPPVFNALDERRADGRPDGHLVLAHEEIAPLAYEYWQQRGCPDGSPEIDWLRAEQELIAHRRKREASYDRV